MFACEFIGNCVKDAELRVTQSGVNVCSFTVAVNDKQNRDNPPTYFRVTAWRKLAEICGKYVKKGLKVYVHGNKIEAQSFESNGETRISLAVTADDIEFLSAKNDGNTNNNTSKPQGNHSQPEPQTGGFTDVTEEFGDLPF